MGRVLFPAHHPMAACDQRHCMGMGFKGPEMAEGFVDVAGVDQDACQANVQVGAVGQVFEAGL